MLPHSVSASLTSLQFLLFVGLNLLALPECHCHVFSRHDIETYRGKVRQMFTFAYDSYMNHAYPYDELRPISCDGMNTWGSFSLTLIDALDTLAVMGNYSEFRRVSKLILDRMDFNMNINVSVFETNIRVVGGLLSAHLLSYKADKENVDPAWPCEGPLLRLAESVARRLLPAFETKTGMPYGTVNLRYGVPVGETPVTCTAGISTYIVEFGTLSRLIGDPVFEDTAMKALWALWNMRSPVGLVGNHLNVEDGKWTALDAGIGAGVDSYYEYLVKGAMLFQRTELMEMFKEYYKVISKHMNRDDWFMWVSMGSGQVTMPVFQSLESYWPGLLSLVGEIEQARKSLYNYYRIWRQYGFIPEFYDIPHGQANAKREGYPLRPELIESVMYLYRATQDPHLLHIGADIFESIECSAKTGCGYATVKNVQDHKIEDRMESFFLAETLKYLYLLFDPENFIHNPGNKGTVIQTVNGECIIDAGGYVFNTEAHPIDAAAVYCCSAQKKEQDELINLFKDNLDLYSMSGLKNSDFTKPFKRSKTVNIREKKKFKDNSEGHEKNSYSQSEVKGQTVILTGKGFNPTPDDSVTKDNVPFEIFSTRESGSINSVLQTPDMPNTQNVEEIGNSAHTTLTSGNVMDESCSAEKLDCSDSESNQKEDIPNSPPDEEGATVDEETAATGILNEEEDSVSPTISGKVLEQMENDVNVVSNRWKTDTMAYWHMVSANGANVNKGSMLNEPPNHAKNVTKQRDQIAVNNSMTVLYENLVCEAQSFVARLSLMGEMFHI